MANLSIHSGHLVAGKNIAVAGAGLGGLAFALALLRFCKEHQVHPLPHIHVFERDSSPDVRAGFAFGYSLGVRSDSGGLQVLHGLGVLDELLQHQEPATAITFASPSFRTLFSVPDSIPPGLPVGRLRITRSNLQRTLLQHFQQTGQQLSFGKVCTDATVLTDRASQQRHVRLAFQDGEQHTCDVLVVADGVNSKIRSALLPDAKPYYAGIVTIAGRTGRLDPLPQEMLHSQVMLLAPNGVTMFLSSYEKHSVSWHISWHAPQSLAAELNAKLQDPTTAQEVYAMILKKTATVAEPWPTLWAHTDKTKIWVSNPMEKLPHQNSAPIICIGDALHAMTPFSGNGANMAFVDAWQLALHLISPHHLTLEAAIAAYNAESAPRCTAAVQGGSANIARWHRQGFAYHMTLVVYFLLGRLLQGLVFLGLFGSKQTSKGSA